MISMTLISSYCRVCLLLQLSKVILVKLIVLLMPYDYGELLNWRLKQRNE